MIVDDNTVTIQYKTRQDKTRQDKTRQDKTKIERMMVKGTTKNNRVYYREV